MNSPEQRVRRAKNYQMQRESGAKNEVSAKCAEGRLTATQTDVVIVAILAEVMFGGNAGAGP